MSLGPTKHYRGLSYIRAARAVPRFQYTLPGTPLRQTTLLVKSFQ